MKDQDRAELKARLAALDLEKGGAAEVEKEPTIGEKLTEVAVFMVLSIGVSTLWAVSPVLSALLTGGYLAWWFGKSMKSGDNTKQ
jgi:hypothetical protein